MFSQWLRDEDELLKFVSGHHRNQQNDELLVTPPQSNSVLPSFIEKNNIIITEKNNKKPRQGRPKQTSAADETPAECLKKIIHRDVERQRRQEMAGLYQSLRSKIPPQFLQGKRSISEHIHGAIRYIRYMQKRTEELKSKRDRLKELLSPCNTTTSKYAVSSSSSSSKRFEHTNISVKPSKTGMEISFSTVLKSSLPLSTVLKVLVLEGMSVKSCISAPVHQKMLHIIHVDQVNEGRRMDPSQLEGKLMSLVSSQ